MKFDEEIAVEMKEGHTMYVKYKGMSEVNKEGKREVRFQVNGLNRTEIIDDAKASLSIVKRERVTEGNKQQVGSPMNGAVVEVKAEVGKKVKAGEPICVLSAAKMENIVSATFSGTLKRVIVKKGEKLAGLVVDELIGQQEIVIKSLGKYINKCKIISGATILGDGEVALILDANALI